VSTKNAIISVCDKCGAERLRELPSPPRAADNWAVLPGWGSLVLNARVVDATGDAALQRVRRLDLCAFCLSRLIVHLGECVRHAIGCNRSCGGLTFNCAKCHASCAACFGAADDQHLMCDDCYWEPSYDYTATEAPITDD
jgi:hypothetical protein